MTIDELKTILENHRLWLLPDPSGKRADLRDADLRGADLKRAYLRCAYLRDADLRDADLRGADLRGAYLQCADLQRADLRRADLRDADLRGADLRGAYLRCADLRDADLRGADLRGAYLQRADLQRAYLRGATGCNKRRTTHLYGMLDQIGPIRAYKVVTGSWTGPNYPTITYRIGEEYESDVLMNEEEQCGSGINLATLDWCINNWEQGYHILIAEFEIKDPTMDICIPIASDGKFRVRKCKIVGEKNLEELGLAERDAS